MLLQNYALPNYEITNFPCPRRASIEVLPTAADLFHAAAEEFIRVAVLPSARRDDSQSRSPEARLRKLSIRCSPRNYADFAWNRIFLFFGDERHVPPTDPESNYRMVNESLLTKIAIPAENVFRVAPKIPMPLPPRPTMKRNSAASLR